MKNQNILAAIAVACSLFTGCDNELYVNEEGNLVPKTVVDDPTLPAIEVNGTKLHSEAFGDPNDPMVIFIHGGPGADYKNGLNARYLADDGYYVVFFDQRGTGLSQRHPYGTFTMQQAIDDLEGVIAHYKTSPAQPVFLFGHSWGAILAAGYINQHPFQIDGAIFAEPGGFTWENLVEYGERTRRLDYFAEATNDAVYLDQFMTGRQDQHAILDYKLGLRTVFTYSPGNDEGIEGPSPFWRNGAVAFRNFSDIADKDGYDMTTNLDMYEPRVLFLYSELNTAYGKEFCEKEAKSFKHYAMAEIKGTGHEMIYFKWDNVHPIVTQWLNSMN